MPHNLIYLGLLLTTTLLISSVYSQTCTPGDNCKAPNCRCWNDPAIPGGLEVSDVPQIVLITFDYAINTANVKSYTDLFEGITNPNKCPALGTFFVTQQNSDTGILKGLFDNGQEIGVSSISGTSPNGQQAWETNLTQVKKALTDANIQADSVLGVRAPQLRPGGVDEFTALAKENFLYDASCSTSTYDDQSSVLWPYTYDFAPGPQCDDGESPEEVFPGKWQILVADLIFNGTKCATPQACTAVTNQRDAFDMFYNSFIQHYEGNRSPFLIDINPDWVTTAFKTEGTKQFLQYIRAAFEDTWILTASQALDWVRQPVPNINATENYAPWACS